VKSSIQSGKESGMIAAILAGDKEQYHELIRPYERLVYNMALTYLKNEEDAEDVAQETFIRAFRKLSTFRDESKFSTWLISIALNEARNRLRRQTAFRFDSLDSPPEDEAAASPLPLRDWREIPSETLEREETRKLLQQAVEMLPEMYRQIFLLRDVEELSVNDTAEVLNISISSVKVRLHRARMMLQRQLAPRLKAIGSKPKRRWFQWS
jgi:RNA polymerase sigma-70 factor, ECF subfamily